VVYDTGRDELVLFGGADFNIMGDTWTWKGTDWTPHLAGSIRLTPRSGPPGSSVRVEAWGFAAGERVKLVFVDSAVGRVFLRKVRANAAGAFTTHVTIPITASQGKQPVKAKGLISGATAKQGFTVT
jgi:hypothetical protein